MSLRIAIFVESWVLGGAQRQALHVASALRSLGHHLELWGLERARDAEPVCAQARLKGLHAIGLGGGRTAPGRMVAAAARLAAGRIDVVLPFAVTANLVAAASWRLGGARGMVWNQRDAGYRLDGVRRGVARLAPLFVANSRAVLRELPRALGVPEWRCRFIPNILEPLSMVDDRARWRDRLAVGRDEALVAVLARLHPGKRLELALATVAASRRRLVVALAGVDQGAGAALRAQAQQLGIFGRVRFLGHVDDVGGLLAAADVGLFTSSPPSATWHGEGTSNAVLETVAMGVPCVCVDDPAVRNIAAPAWIATPDPALMARTLDQVLDDPGATAEARSRGRALLENYSSERVGVLWQDALMASMSE